jgi:pimeloyl-ACP methyl ester carboxylesterase
MTRKGRLQRYFMRSIVAETQSPLSSLYRNRQPLRARTTLLLLLLVWLSLSLSGCAWLSDKERQAALRPSADRPAQYIGNDTVGLRPGDLRFLVAVPAAGSAAAATSSTTSTPATPAMTEQLALWWLPQADPSAPTLLYLHGTLRSLYYNLPKIEALRDAGFAVLAVDYRGWGDSTAIIPSEATIAADVDTAWAELKRRQPLAGQRVIFGHSMGGAAAVTLASRLHYPSDYGALVLESTFTSLPDVAATAGFWGRIGAAITTLKFNSLAKIGRVDAPLLILHGSADKTVPIALGQRLRDAARPGVRWVEVPGGSHSRLHADAPEVYRQAMQSVIKRLAVQASSAIAATAN